MPIYDHHISYDVSGQLWLASFSTLTQISSIKDHTVPISGFTYDLDNGLMITYDNGGNIIFWKYIKNIGLIKAFKFPTDLLIFISPIKPTKIEKVIFDS